MSKMFFRYFPEIAIGFVFFIFSIVLGVVTNNVLVTLFFALFSLIVSLLLIWMGQRISSAYASHRTFEDFFQVVANVKTGSHSTGMGMVSDDFAKIVEQATKTLKASPPRAAIIKSQIEDLSRGVYIVANPSKIYDHNKEFLKSLKRGDVFQTTHVVSQNLKAHIDEDGTGESNFNTLIKAYEHAAKSLIHVMRIYIFKEYTDITKGYWMQMKKLDDAGVSIKILLEHQIMSIDIEEEKRDITLFGNRVIGIADFNEKVIKATYIVKRPDTEEEFNRQVDKLKQLEDLAENLQDIVATMPDEVKQIFV